MAFPDMPTRRKDTLIDGCRPSLYGGNTLTSTGNSALDTIIGEWTINSVAEHVYYFLSFQVEDVLWDLLCSSRRIGMAITLGYWVNTS